MHEAAAIIAATIHSNYNVDGNQKDLEE